MGHSNDTPPSVALNEAGADILERSTIGFADLEHMPGRSGWGWHRGVQPVKAPRAGSPS
jgi:hypothetical protein